jgi:hypothetical protein
MSVEVEGGGDKAKEQSFIKNETGTIGGITLVTQDSTNANN